MRYNESMKYDLFLESFRRFIRDCPEESLDEGARYVFLSDLHMGNGGSRDDLSDNGHLICTILEKWYLARDYFLILNGDIEDISKFPLSAIHAAWPSLLDLFDRFAKKGRLRKIVGNHDFDLLHEKDYRWPLLQGLVLRRGNDRLFVFHGQQAYNFYVKFDFLSEFLIRWFVRPLNIRNAGVRFDSHKRFAAERRIYRAARMLGVAAVCGHTHRPLFESLSKFDHVRFTLEKLLDRYIDADVREKTVLERQIALYRSEILKLASEREKQKKTQSLYGSEPFLIPCIFNSGCAIGKHGINALEIEDGKISLVYWTSGKDERPYLASESRIRETIGSEFFRYTLQSDRLDGIFTRINLLGDTSESC